MQVNFEQYKVESTYHISIDICVSPNSVQFVTYDLNFIDVHNTSKRHIRAAYNTLVRIALAKLCNAPRLAPADSSVPVAVHKEHRIGVV